jgi:flagellar hook-associated protein 1 FlgK
MSNELGVRSVLRSNNDMALYADSGVTLFDRSPRKVEFDRSLSMTPGQPGNAVIIDGVPVTGANATMPLQNGRIVGLVQARDDISLTYQAQLDEMARVLVKTFAETDQNGLLPDMPGLFTYAGATGVPPDGVLVPGMALALRVNANVDPDQGGSAWRLRDGGIAGPDYVVNTAGSASYTDRIDALIEKMGESNTYDAAGKITISGTLADFSAVSAGWLSEARKVADDSYQYQYTLHQRSYESFNRVTGVNLDEEVAEMLELERSFSTSSKLISVVDNMFNSLLAAIG